MHIVYVEGGYPHPHGGGGAGTYVQLVGRELVHQGHQVTVIASACPDCPLDTIDQGVRVLRPGGKGALHWYASRLPLVKPFALALRSLEQGWIIYRMLEHLHRRQPIHVVEFTEGGDFWHSLRGNLPFICHLHGSRYTSLHQAGKPVDWSDWLDRRLGLWAIARAGWVVSPSQAMLDVVQSEAGKAFRRSAVIPYPLDPRLLEPRLLEAPTGRSPQSADNKVVLFAARNDPVKGADVLLNAVPLVRRVLPQAEFRFFGYQPAPGEVLPDGMVCHPFVPKDELFSHFGQADVVVVPSRWDNSPNTVYEAMAAGKAVVASNVGGIPELVVDWETGHLTPAGDSKALASAIIAVLLNHARGCKMGQSGQERIRQLAGVEANVTQRLAIYHKINSEAAQSSSK